MKTMLFQMGILLREWGTRAPIGCVNAREIAADADLLSSAKRKLVPKRPPSPGDIHDVTRRARNPSQRGIRYRMLKYGQEYVDKGTEYYEQRYRQQQILLLQKKAAKLGLQITVAHS
jgi:hypothetical protein